eukprot:9498913-Pyramimonas_sp.AAC.1
MASTPGPTEGMHAVALLSTGQERGLSYIISTYAGQMRSGQPSGCGRKKYSNGETEVVRWMCFNLLRQLRYYLRVTSLVSPIGVLCNSSMVCSGANVIQPITRGLRLHVQGEFLEDAFVGDLMSCSDYVSEVRYFIHNARKGEAPSKQAFN